MAAPITAKFSELKILVGDGASPTEAFAIICGITEKSVAFQSNTQTTVVPDCTDEDAPAYETPVVDSQKVTINLNGVWSQADHGTILQWWKGGSTKNIKVQFVNADVGDTEFLNGPALLVSLTNSVSRGQKMRGDMSIEFAAMPTFVDAT